MGRNESHESWKLQNGSDRRSCSGEKPMTEMSGSPQRRGRQATKLGMKKLSTKMDMFIPDNLMYEMKPIDRIETKF